MTIGLKRGTVQLVSYNPRWHDEFEAEAQRLRKIIGKQAKDIQHIGSTAIPGIHAKPLIDICVAIDSLEQVNELIPKLVDAGYEYMPERITPERAFFPKGPREQRTHHLSFVLAGSKEWHDVISFRDYMRSHPEAAKEYDALKAKLATQFADDRYAYTAAKESFIDSILTLAS